MDSENIWITTQPIKDRYGYSLPEGEAVKWKPGHSVTAGVIHPALRGCESYATGSPLFRPPTEKELRAIAKELEANPLSHSMSLRPTHVLGSDPEIFVVDGEGKVIPAFRFLGAAPERWDYTESQTTSPYWDGFQAEFQLPTCTCIASWVDVWQTKLKQLRYRACSYNPTARIVATPTLPIHWDVLESCTPQESALGCQPSQNVYGVEGVGIEAGQAFPWRFAGCHFHIQTGNHKDLVGLVKTLDRVVGVLSVAILDGLEDPIRREHYGRAGEYRTPSYGIEYRTLSSAVLWHPALVHIFSNLIRFATQLSMYGFESRWDCGEDEGRRIINTLDVDGARSVIVRNRAHLEDLLWALYHDPSQAAWKEYKDALATGTLPSPKRIVDEFLLQGVRKYIELDIEKNWHLTDGQWLSHSEGPESQGWRALLAWLGPEKG